MVRNCCMTLSLPVISPTDCALLPSSLTLLLLFSSSPPNLCSSCLRPLPFSPHICFCVSVDSACSCPCVQMYPTLPISHVEESRRPVTIHAWCKKGWGRCQTHPFIVVPYRCLGKNQHLPIHQLYHLAQGRLLEPIPVLWCESDEKQKICPGWAANPLQGTHTPFILTFSSDAESPASGLIMHVFGLRKKMGEMPRVKST